MSGTPQAVASGARGVAAATALCAVAAVGIVVITALAVGQAGLADEARRLLRFGFGGIHRSPAEAARIALHNARFAAGTLLCAVVTPRLTSRAQTLVDALLGALLAFNAGAIGVAIGAYGSRVISATALHLPLEFAALSLAGGAYMHASKQPLGPRTLALVAAACALLLATAATLETYVSIGGLR